MKEPVLIEKRALKTSVAGAFLLLLGEHDGGHIRFRRHPS